MRAALWCLVILTACGAAAPERASSAAPLVKEAEVAAPQVGRKEIVTGDARVRVDAMAPFREALSAELARLGGRIEGEDVERTAGEVSFAHLQLAVPADRWDELVGWLDQSGELGSVHVRRADVTEAWVDLDAREKNLRAAEQRLLALLNDRAGALPDVLAVEQELTRVRGEIEAGAGRLRVMNEQIAMSRMGLTVEVTAPWTPAVVPAFPEEASRVLGESTRLLSTTARGLALFGVALSPWLLALAALGLPVAAWLRRRSPVA